MRVSQIVQLAAVIAPLALSQETSTVTDQNRDVKYIGFERNGIEVFLNIKYGQDTGGENRFKPPKPFKPTPGTVFDGRRPGPACPQKLGPLSAPLAVGNITDINEDCLNLNVARPAGMGKKKLPVMVWIHGGGFWSGFNMEPTTMPDGLILQSVTNGLPVMHVGINYRLGFFGFAQSDALEKERSENAGLRDQRLALEWVRDNIAAFGGDPSKITIFGQSSGGLAVGLQLLAYGGTQPLPYQQGICQSQALEAGITGNFTITAMSAVINHVGCDKTPLHSEETITCLRKLDTQTLLMAAIETYENDISHNVGDIWLPTVDGDFLPAPPSQLVKEGKFGNATYMFGWTEDDLNILTDPNIKADEDTRKNIGSFLPGMPPAALDQLLEQYPVEEFEPPSGTNLSAEFYRTGRILRDVIMVCQPFFMAESMHQKYSSIGHPAGLPYMYDFNQTILEPILEQLTGLAKLGVVHTAEFPYVFGNLTHWNVPGWPWSPTPQDHEVLKRVSRSWSTFASTGSPSARGRYTLQGWDPAYSGHDSSAGPNIYVIGGPFQGRPNLALDENLIKRCELLNSPEFIDYQGY